MVSLWTVLPLFDDGNHSDGDAGDSLYANTWLVSSSESNIIILIFMLLERFDTVINHMDNMGAFTTVGPVVFEDYQFSDWVGTPNPGENISFSISLRNNGSTATASGIKAMLTSQDTLGALNGMQKLFDDIAPGEMQVSKGGKYSLKISEDCPVGKEIPIAIDIFSNNYLFWTDTFSITVEAPDNVIDIIKPDFRTYPNPATNQLTIEFDNTVNQITSIMLYEITGKAVYSEILEKTASSTYTIDLSSIQEGMYFIRISNDEYSFTEKLIKVE